MNQDGLKKKKVSELVIDDFVAKIESGKLKENDRLPNLSEYAKQLGVSRLCLREALQTLEEWGAVKSRPKIGTIITCADSRKWKCSLLDSVGFSVKSVEQFFEARIYIESELAAMCARNISAEDTKALFALCERHREALENMDTLKFNMIGHQFHVFISEHCGNMYMHRMYMEFDKVNSAFIAATFSSSAPIMQFDCISHYNIYQAIATRDGELARQCTADHGRYIQRKYIEYVKRQARRG